MTNRSAAGWVFAVALALRLSLAAATSPPAVVVNDAAEYDAIAVNLLSGRGFAIHPGVPTPARAPLYPVFLAGVYAVFGHSVRAALAVQGALSAATCVLLLWLVRETLADERAARAAAWLQALYPILIVYSCRLISETFFTFLLAASMLHVARYQNRGRPAELAFAGLLLGLATLARPGGMLMPGVVLGLLLLRGFRHLVPWLGYTAAFVVVLVPWSMRNKELFGFGTLTAHGPGFGFFVTGHMTEGLSYDEADALFRRIAEQPQYQELTFTRGVSPVAELEKRLNAEGTALIRAHPFGYAKVVLRRFVPFWLTSHSGVVGIELPLSEYRRQGRWGPVAARLCMLAMQGALLAAALWGAWLARRRWLGVLTLAAVPAYMTIHIVFDMVPRYHVPALPYLLALAAVALVQRYRPLGAEVQADGVEHAA